MRFEIETITPARARTIIDATLATPGANLRTPYSNGSSLNAAAMLYADAMRNGRWRWADASPIRLSSSGQLCSDGLHRLAAAERCKFELRAMVLYGDEVAAGTESDRGKGRTVAQLLRSRGVAQSNNVAAATRLLIDRAIETQLGLAATSRIHVDDVVETYDKFESAFSHAGSRPKHVSGLMNVSAYMAMLVALHQWGPDAVDEFHALMLSTSIDERSPVRAMRLAAVRHVERAGRPWTRRATFSALSKAHHLETEGKLVVRRWLVRSDEQAARWPFGVDPNLYLLRDYAQRAGR